MSHEHIQLDTLNERELEIIALLEERLSNKEIANQLFLAESTVKWYVRQLNTKLDTSNRHEIVARANELGLLEAQAPAESYLRLRQNLPRQTTPFVGRDAELDEIHTIIEKEDVRLLTILAQGGMGKTRIALEASEQQLNRYPDGIYFVPLQALSDVNNIVPQIAISTGFQFSNDGHSQKEQILNFLANKTMLLCMDNWEHLLDGVDLLNEILQSAPDVKIIATSREKLNLMSETVYVLHGMNYPDWETPEDALEYDAVQLLLQSAQRVKPDWEVTPDNLDYVARICQVTQGMPLAILLATSWLDVYSLERICDEIQKSADILETEMRDVPERQRSIRAIFDHSWERLKAKERDAFMKMSVFRGGCTPSAAEAVTGASARILQSLVNKALLLRNRGGRYNVHELLRQYAAEKLEQSGEMQVTHDAHMNYYTEAINKREKHLYDTRLIQAVEDIKSDFDNAKVAWSWALQQADYEKIGAMLMTLDLFSQYSARREEIKELFTQAVDNWSKNSDRLLWVNVQLILSRLLIRFGYYLDAQSLLDPIYDIFEKSDNQFGKAQVLNSLGEVNMLMWNLSKANSFFEQSFSILEKYDDELEFAYLNLNMSALQDRLSNSEKSYSYTKICYEIAHSLGHQHLMAKSLNNMALYYDKKGDFDKALDFHKKALAIRRFINDFDGIALTLYNMAEIEFDRENHDKEKEYRLESLSIILNYQNMRSQVHVFNGLAKLELKLNNKALAKTYLDKALNLSRKIPIPFSEARCLITFAELYIEDDKPLGLDYCYQAIAMALKIEHVNLKIDIIKLVTKIFADIVDKQLLVKWLCITLKSDMYHTTRDELSNRLELFKQKISEEEYVTACSDTFIQTLDELLSTILEEVINIKGNLGTSYL